MKWLQLAVLTCILLHGGKSRAQDALQCGTPIQRHLEAGATHTYVLSPSTDSIVVVNVVDISSTPSLLRIKAEGGLDTCSGGLSLAASPGSTIEVSDCIGSDAIDYTITANVVSGGSANCGLSLPCGLVPYVRDWSLSGAVTPYRLQAETGDEVTLIASDGGDAAGKVSVQVFDPEGAPVGGASSCGGEVHFRARLSGLYTALVTACTEARNGRYLIGYVGAQCPQGPEISHFGIARGDGSPVDLLTYDEEGRPVYTRVGGTGFRLVIEATPGANGAAPGLVGFDYDAEDPTVLPDLQVLFSRPLGNGNPEVCAQDPNARDGIPATQPLVFADTKSVSAAINDFGCHIDDGMGHAYGVDMSIDACTIFSDGTSHFVSRLSTAQFCAEIPGIRQFPAGDTIVAARVRDQHGVAGPVREMIVRVESIPTPTPTPSRSPTPIMSPSPSATTTTALCTGDCNHDKVVSFGELASAVELALAKVGVSCDLADADHDGVVSVDEIVRAVRLGALGCSAAL